MSVLGYKGIYEPMQNRHAVKQVQQIYHAEEDGEEKDSSPSSQTSEEAVQRKRDAFAQLKAGNPDSQYSGGLSGDAVLKGQSGAISPSWIR